MMQQGLRAEPPSVSGAMLLAGKSWVSMAMVAHLNSVLVCVLLVRR